MEHSFDIDIAKEYGIPAAILLKHIYYWVEKNRANKKHLIEGEYWTYCSVKAFGELFPYMSAKVIRNGLTKLEDGELIKTGCFNTQFYDRTKWYTLTDKGRTLCRNGKRPLDKKATLFDQKGEPIPYKEPYIDTYSFSKEKDNKNMSTFDYRSIEDAWNELSVLGIRKVRKLVPGSERYKMLKARLNEYGEDSFDEIIERVAFLVGHHHTTEGVDGLDWQILLEADYLVNADEGAQPKEKILEKMENMFKTKSGIALLKSMYSKVLEG